MIKTWVAIPFSSELCVIFVNKKVKKGYAAEQTCKRNIRIEEEDDGSMNSSGIFRPGSYL
jgi:hypothetical protein